MKKRDDIIAGSLLMTGAVVGMLAFAASSFVVFPPKISTQEQFLADFAPAIPPLTIRQPVAVTGLACPVTIAAAPAETMPVSFPPGLPPQPENSGTATASGAVLPPAMASGPTVSMIIVNDQTRLAIINGKVVKEGDRHAQWRVARIEKNRVLLREGKDEQWLRLD